MFSSPYRQLASPLVFGDLVQSLDVPPEGEEVPEHTPCTVVGWGAITESGDYHSQLQKVSFSPTLLSFFKGNIHDPVHEPPSFP